jgi:ribosomal protein S27E
MSTHALNILENAIDSLSEALAKYQQGEDGDHKAYKFAILHTSHFLELMFKHYIAQKHELLIYKNPFAQTLDKQSTITFWDAVNFISHDTGELKQNSEFRKDLDWLKKLRNEIEHYKFEMDVAKAREAIGRIFAALDTFLSSHTDISLEDHVPVNLTTTFKVLSDEYEKKRYEAVRTANAAESTAYRGVRPKEHEFVAFRRYDCPECENPTMIPDQSSSSGYKCTFCGNEENDRIEVSCDSCGLECAEEEMEIWQLDDGGSEYRCAHCSGSYQYSKDD